MERKHSRKGSWFRKSKEDTKLTPEQKRRSKMTSTTDPTKAMTEEEPFAMAQAKPTESMRSAQYKDVYGNPIVEPDLTNPTRSRWERPLETIRSFEAQINKDLRRQSAFVVVDQIDNMDQTQKQVHHTAGPFDPSLYHRNNGAQRYAPVDAYNRNSQGSGYYHHGGNSQDSFDRNAGPYGSRRQSMRSNGHAPVEQIPPMSHINSFGRPGQDAPNQYHGPRRVPGGDYQKPGFLGSPGHVQDHYSYNSDPASESSSFGSNNTPLVNDYDVQFGDTPMFSQQLDGQYSIGNGSGQGPNGYGYANNNGYISPVSPVGDQSRNPYRNGAMSPNNPYINGGDSNGGYAGTNGTKSPSSPTSPGGMSGTQRKPVPAAPAPPAPPSVPVKSYPPAAPVVAVPEPKKKKKGLLKRLSKS